MSLLLDTRQRAMLEAMGITLWSPEAPQETAASTPGIAPPAAPPALHHQPAAAAPSGIASPAPQRAASTQKPPLHAPTTAQHPAANSTTGWVLHPPQRLFPSPSAQPTRHALVTEQVRQARWLIVAQNTSPAQPLAGDWGTLLGNMLQAMGLHQHPDVWITTLEPPLSAALMPAGGAGANTPPDITDTIAQLAPTIVLLLGATAARAALGDRGTTPLGQLRGQVHLVGSYPAVVTYDPSFLLRSAHNKAGAWMDLCTALAHINNTPASSQANTASL